MKALSVSLSGLLLALMLALTPAAPAAAQQGPADDIGSLLVHQLQDQGYSGIQTSHTLLGRLRIVAQLDGMQREIVINPYTGEILRDYLTPRVQVAQKDKRSSTGSSGNTAVSTAADAVGTAVERVSVPDLVKSSELTDAGDGE